MSLERQDIEKKNFPIGSQGYEAEAVDAHLKAVADEVEKLQSSARRRSDTLASAASDQVRAIIEAAEQSAAVIHRQAEEDAQEIRAEATAKAQSTRDEAAAQARDAAAAEAREHVGKLSASTASMRQRLDAMESELGGLIESLRTGSDRLKADLTLLETNLGDARATVAPGAHPGGAAQPERAIAPQPPAEDELPASAEAIEAVPAEGQAIAAVEEVDEPLTEPAPAAPAETTAVAGPNGADDTEGARLIALNMALNGTPRDETDRYLADNFSLSDRAGLLDEVYASVEG